LTTTTGCLSCGNPQLSRVRPYRSKSREGRALFGGSWLEECAVCGLVQIVPVPPAASLDRYYRDDYRKLGAYGADVADTSKFPRDNLFYFNRGRAVAELVAPHFAADQSLRILDIGAGFGHILHALGTAFPKATLHAIEYSALCVRHLRGIGITVDSESVETVLERAGEPWDLIILSHVLEHLREPAETLEAIRSRLAPGGLLYVEVPNITREGLRTYPDHFWAPRYDEPHTMFFTQDVVTRVLERAGFASVFCNTAGPHYQYVSALRYRLPPLRSTLARLLPKPVFDFLRRQQTTKGVRVQEHEPSFFQFGGDRIWIRTLVKVGADPALIGKT
jgi:2-polyprenyl-3-methyl-5-hydroxy-6-metoxy-1,4-benzoquinol methylase